MVVDGQLVGVLHLLQLWMVVLPSYVMVKLRGLLGQMSGLAILFPCPHELLRRHLLARVELWWWRRLEM